MNFMDDTVAAGLPATHSDSDDNEHMGGVVYAVKSMTQKTAHYMTKPRRGSNSSESETVITETMDMGKNRCQPRYDNYSTVKDGEEINIDELLDDHSKREETERQVVLYVY